MPPHNCIPNFLSIICEVGIVALYESNQSIGAPQFCSCITKYIVYIWLQFLTTFLHLSFVLNSSKLRELVSKIGKKKWSKIAKNLPGRIGKQCRERWFNHLKPGTKVFLHFQWLLISTSQIYVFLRLFITKYHLTTICVYLLLFNKYHVSIYSLWDHNSIFSYTQDMIRVILFLHILLATAYIFCPIFWM